MDGESQIGAAPSFPGEVVIRAEGGAELLYWRDVWSHRELIYFLVWRDIILRYKQTIIGIGWAVLRPLVTTLVMVLVFSRLAGLGSDGLPYSLVVLSGLLAWQLFS